MWWKVEGVGRRVVGEGGGLKVGGGYEGCGGRWGAGVEGCGGRWYSWWVVVDGGLGAAVEDESWRIAEEGAGGLLWEVEGMADDSERRDGSGSEGGWKVGG